jgi:dTDP-4-dehydrorhamnose reductase
MRVLVTGAGGMMGRALMLLMKGRHQATGLARADLDVADAAAVERRVAEERPQLVIHAGAMTRVDDCEKEWEEAFRVNALGSRHVAVAAERAGASLVYLSSDFVFDGAKEEPYLEWEEPRPLSVYGASKLAGEREVRAHATRHYVVRTSWVFGPGGRNFVDAILAAARAGKPLRVVTDQVGVPTYTRDLAAALLELAESGFYGTYHVTNAGSCSWHEYACTILRLAGMKDVPVGETTAAAWGAPAPRPAYSVLRNFAWIQSGFGPLRPWTEALEDYLRIRETA